MAIQATPFILDHPTVGFGTVTALRLLSSSLHRVARVALAVLRWLAVVIVAVSLAPLLLALIYVRLIVRGKLDLEKDRWLRPVAKVIDWAKNPLLQERRLLSLDPSIIAINETQGPKPGIKALADVLVINNVEESFQWKQRLIQAATQSIEWSFNYAGGAPFRLCLKLISKQMEKHADLRVHLILSSELLTRKDRILLKQIKKTYENRFFALVTSIEPKLIGGLRLEENHAKLLVVDGKYFSLGGTGVQQQMVREKLKRNEKKKRRSLAAGVMDLCFRDTDIIGQSYVENNIAETMRGQFFNLYRIWVQRMDLPLKRGEGSYFPLNQEKGKCGQLHVAEGLIKNAPMRFIVGGPEHAGNNPINHALIYHFQKARKVIRIANLLFNPSKKVLAAFKSSQAHKIGYFNSTTKNHSAARAAFANLTRQNYYLFNKIHEYDVPHQLYHKKVFIIDDNLSYVGSYNFGAKSDRCDYEVIGIFEDERVAGRLNEGLEQDAQRSKVIYPKPKQESRSKVRAWPFNLVAPLFF